jgi:hypothetical protein
MVRTSMEQVTSKIKKWDAMQLLDRDLDKKDKVLCEYGEKGKFYESKCDDECCCELHRLPEDSKAYAFSVEPKLWKEMRDETFNGTNFCACKRCKTEILLISQPSDKFTLKFSLTIY